MSFLTPATRISLASGNPTVIGLWSQSGCTLSVRTTPLSSDAEHWCPTGVKTHRLRVRYVSSPTIHCDDGHRVLRRCCAIAVIIKALPLPRPPLLPRWRTGSTAPADTACRARRRSTPYRITVASSTRQLSRMPRLVPCPTRLPLGCTGDVSDWSSCIADLSSACELSCILPASAALVASAAMFCGSFLLCTSSRSVLEAEQTHRPCC